jgi:hypothetical protein
VASWAWVHLGYTKGYTAELPQVPLGKGVTVIDALERAPQLIDTLIELHGSSEAYVTRHGQEGGRDTDLLWVGEAAQEGAIQIAGVDLQVLRPSPVAGMIVKGDPRVVEAVIAGQFLGGNRSAYDDHCRMIEAFGPEERLGLFWKARSVERLTAAYGHLRSYPADLWRHFGEHLTLAL